MIEHLKEIDEAGIVSLKIEGRMKSPYYVATVVNAYRRAIDNYYANKEKPCDKALVEELEKTSHRRYTTGFYFGAKDKEYIVWVKIRSKQIEVFRCKFNLALKETK